MNENANNTNTAPVTPAEQETTVVADNIGTDSQRFVDKVIKEFSAANPNGGILELTRVFFDYRPSFENGRGKPS